MITIVDYGVGNVGSILNMLRKVGAKARLGSHPDDIASAEKLILPGIGHFGHGMRMLGQSGMTAALEEQALVRKVPTLGICLGMQMMTRGSEESDMPGLGWVAADTARFPATHDLRVPHMGWNKVTPNGDPALFNRAASEADRYYFVHSYFVRTDRPEDTAAYCDYGVRFTAAFQTNNLFGAQFHPEKSHMFGMKLLRKFADL